MSEEIELADIVWDPSIYPRQKWSASTIDRYADAMEAGDEFPPLVLEKDTKRLLDGKQRMEAYKKVSQEKIPVEYHEVPEGMTAKYHAATLSARHGDRLSNSDLKVLAREEFKADPTQKVTSWGDGVGVSARTVRRWVSDIKESWKNQRVGDAWRLTRLGYTQREAAEVLGVDQSIISRDMQNGHLSEMHKDLPAEWNDQCIADYANRTGLPPVVCWAAALQDMDDAERLERLGIKIKPYDVWNFSSCHDLMGGEHPGRIPGELICHVLYFFTEPGGLMIDPMAGSGTALDASLLMGREARGYDIDQRHDRVDVEQHNLSAGWPDVTEDADLVFWDPPYFDKKKDEYSEDSISGLARSEYLEWFKSRFSELQKTNTRLAFLMADWNENKGGVFIWDYAQLLQDTGWSLIRQIQCPLPTQQIHPDIVKKFRHSRRLARLNRSLIIAE